MFYCLAYSIMNFAYKMVTMFELDHNIFSQHFTLKTNVIIYPPLQTKLVQAGKSNKAETEFV